MAIRGHDLQKYIDKETKPPVTYVATSDDSEGFKINPIFLDRQRQDQLLMSWMSCFMSKGILTRIVRCETSLQSLEKLQMHFTPQMKAKVRQLKTQLETIKKQNLSANSYLLKLNSTIDALAAISHPITESDYVEHILEGLLEEYDSFVTAIMTRSEAYTVDEIEALILSREA